MCSLLKKAMLIFVVVLTTFTSFARKFYFSSSSGNDSYSIAQAQNPATPWQTLRKLQTLITNGNTTFLPGDTIAFKRGDVFANGHTAATGFSYVSCSWLNYPAWGYTAPSGTANAPIVLTNYGDPSLPKPNFLYPTTTIPTTSNSNNVFEIGGVSWIVIDGLQFNDTRFPSQDKINPSYTRSAILFGTWENSKFNGTDTIWGSNADPANRKRMVSNCVVKNCYFSNVSFAFGMIAGINCKITNNVIENLKTCTDTTGTYDVGAGAFEGVYGWYNDISYNYVKGAWGKSGRVSSTFGLLGVGVDIFCLKNSRINYNTFIDCSGAWEIGNIDRYDYNSGAQYDTFAYNKVINCGQMGYIHGGAANNDPFAGNNRNIACWNNVVINNNSSRMSGPNFGYDLYNDGQSFRGNSAGAYAWWFFRSPTKCPDNTLPVSNTSWSNPINPPYCNYGGHRFTVQYSTDNIRGNADTLVDMRNNIFYSTVGDQMVYDASRTKFKRRNNIYYVKGAFLNPTIVGGPLGASEVQTTARLFMDTTDAYPENWDLRLAPNCPAIGAGVSLGFSKDFGGNNITGSVEAGLYEYTEVSSSNLNASASNTAISCFGGTSSVTITATGGTSPYVGTGVFTVSAGTHSFIVTDAAGASDTVSMTVSQPAVINVSISSGTIAAPGGTTSIQVNANGGTGAFQYSLNGGTYQSSNIFNNVAAGNHTVNVKDANGCIMPKSFTITAPVTSPLIVSATAGNILCSGGTTAVNVTASGGIAPYTGTGSFTVVAGTYTYNVTDAAGTTQSASVTVAQPSLLTLSLTAGTIASYGGTTSVNAVSTGGTGNKTYSIDGGSYQTSSTFTGVAAGVHSVTVKDANNCTKTSSITLSQPLPPTLNIQAVAGNIVCNGGATTVTVTATGGVAPYSGTGSFTVSAGTYTYTVSDNNGATTSTTITVGQPATLSVSATSGVIAAPGGNTTVSAAATGGVAPYTYKLDGGAYQSSSSFVNVLAGNHTITVRDLNGCTKSTALSIAEPSANLTSNVSAGVIACFGGTTTVTVTALGGTPPYTGIGNYTVSAGTYSYTVTDANGISQTNSITVSQPAFITVSATSGTITVSGGTTTLTINAAGGTPPFTYILDNTGYQTTNVFNSVAAGYHSIMVKDANGCIGTGNITIADANANPLTVRAVAGSISCYGGSTIATVTATGGVLPYAGTGNFSVGAGVRNFTVTDASGQTSTVSLTIVQPAELVVSATPTGDIATIGGTTTVTVTASGGTPIYKYSLDGGVFQTGTTFRAVGAGAHYVTAMDANSCVKVVTFTVGQLETSGFVLNLVGKSDVTCRGGNDGKIEVQPTGGRAPYQYAIGNGVYSINNRFFNLRAGIYRVKAKDANGNIAEIIVSILDGRRRCSGRTTARGDEQLSIEVSAYPNPSNARFNVTVQPVTDEVIYIEVMDLYGKKIFQDKGDAEKEFHFGDQFKAGVYFLRVKQGEFTATSKLIKM